MKPIYSLIFALLFLLTAEVSFSQGVGIGVDPPDASAMLDVTSSTKGFLPPRIADPSTITSPAAGLLVYNTTTNKLNYYNGTAWQEVVTGNFVDLTSDQTIAGLKTFANNLTPGGRLLLPMAEVSFFNFATPYAHTISATSTGASGNDNMAAIVPTGIVFMNDNFGTNPSGTRLTYTGATTRKFHTALSFSFFAGAQNDEFVFGVAKNGTVIDASKVVIKSGTSDPRSSAMHILVEMAQNDYIEFYVGKIGGTGTVNIISLNFFSMGM